MASLAACGDPRRVESAPPRFTDTLPTAVDTRARAAILQPVPSSTVEPTLAAVQLEVADGKFLGIGIGSSLADAVRTFGVSPVLENAVGACLPRTQRWVINANALTMIFEGRSAGTARLTSWMYTGGPAVGFTQLVVSGGLTIDGTRQELLSQFPRAVDLGSAIHTGDTADLRFGMRGDSITWFGRTDCGELVDQFGPASR